MKFKKFTEKAAALSMATAMLASVCAPTYTAVLSAVPVAAASSKDTTNNTATTKDLANADIIDTSKTGSITVHKYDITSAEAAGDYTEGQYKATGESDNRVENALADYAIQGVQFTYLRVGNIEQYSKTDGTGSNIKVVYEIPTALAQILKLNEADATVMTGDGVSAPCTNAGVLHYTSTQIEDALAAIIKADDVAAKNALESYLIEYKDQNKDSDDVQTADTGVIETDANGLATKSGLPLGLYLMVETKVPEQVTSTVNPWFISLPFTNTAADTNTNTDHAADGVADSIGGEKWLYDFVSYPKNQTGNPTIDKAVRNAYSSDAKDRNGVVTSSKDTNYSGAFDSKSLIVYNADTAAENKADTTDAAYVANRGGYTSANNTEAGKDGKGYSNDFKYDDTTTASEGDLLDYRVVSKLPHITSKATYLSQYTFTDATKVQFKLYNSTDAYYVIAKKAEDGLYYVTGKTMDKAQATTFTPAASGKLYIKGLEGDKYQLTEVATDDGYTLLKDQMVINIEETKRDIKASVAGTTGLDDAAADNIIANYGTGIKNEDGQLVNAATTDIGSKAVAGPTSETANGRTIGKTDMYVGDIQAATATVDSKPCTLLTSSTGDTTSPNAEVKMAIENNKGFNMPLTGGTGLVGLVILGAGLLGGGVYSMTRNKKKEETAC